MPRNYKLGKRGRFLFFSVFLFANMQFGSLSIAELNPATYLESERRCGVKGQNLIDAGDYEEAIVLLGKGIEKFPSSDWLIGLYGEALYLGGHLGEGESQFRNALSINKNNPVAKKYIVEIRKTQDLLEDRNVAEWISIAKDKGADLLLLVIGVWIGTLLTIFSERFIANSKRVRQEHALNLLT